MNKAGHRACPACNSMRARHYGNKNGFEILGCRRCRTLYTDRVPVASEAQDYDEYYTELNLSVPDFIRVRLKEIIAEFEPYRKTNRLLDIGFGAGTLLDVANEMGWEVHGIEVSRPAVEQAQSKGFDVIHSDLKGSGFNDGFFDVVTASEILEHLSDPDMDLRMVSRILRPAGLFWGTTPSASSISFKLLKLNWSMLSPPEHIQLYSNVGVSILLKNAGFDRVRMKTYGLNPMEIRNYYRSSDQPETEFARVSSAYELNESLMKTPFRKTLKNAMNESLNLLGIGDSLKIYATTSGT